MLVQYASAQLDVFTPPKPQPLWKADTLYIGASFTRTSFDPVTIWLIGNEAGWTGNLYVINPKTGQETFLFTNHSTPNQKIVLSDLFDIPLGDTVYFDYKVVTPASGTWPAEASRKAKYTGANIPGQSKYVAEAVSAKYGHRWSVAGRVNDSLVQFGFEDNVNAVGTQDASDMDFDDIIFGTTLSLGNNEVPARLYFTDKTGKILPAGAFYSPGNDSVYLSYTDDYANGSISKSFVLNVKNRKGTAAPDSESFAVLASSHNGAIGTWTLAIPIEELPGKPGDKILQSFYLGEVTATVKTHNRFSLLDGNSVTATLNIAYPDKPETVKILNCADSTADIVRTTNCIKISAVDQSFTRNRDTVYAEVKCDASGDIIGKVQLIEQAGGGYISGDIVKNETTPPGAADQILSCKSTDNITVTYTDEVYGNRVTDKKGFNNGAAESFQYVKTADQAAVITTITDGDAPTFTAVVKAPTPTVDVVDIIDVVITTSQGDKETFKATETGPNTGVFTVNIPFGFQTTAALSGSGKLEGFLDPVQAVTSVLATGVATANAKEYTAAITLKPALNLAKKAYIKDANGDGRGDMVYIVFSRPVDALPTSLTPTYWNVGGDTASDNTAAPLLTILPGSPNVLVADFSASPFRKGLTSVGAGVPPFATLPSDNIFGGQKPVIADSMGPIVVSATIKPFNSLLLTSESKELNVDTIRVYISETLKTRSDFKELLRFSKSANGVCTDYAHSLPVVPNSNPTDNGDGSYTLLVGGGNEASPVANDCVYLDASGTYTDIYGNLPPIHGELLIGAKPPLQIELFRGYPPVAGMNTNAPGFVVVNNDSRTDHGSEYSTRGATGYQTIWVPPADFPANYVPGQSVYIPVVPAIGAAAEPGKDASRRSVLPPDISTIQVISTGEYIADISIYDNLGNFLKSFQQAFGYRGELSNQERAAKRGWASYLVWDMKNAKGQKAGQGVYVWKVVFRFKVGKQEIRYTRTGVMRNFANATTTLP
ncbi:MAG: hypothetical protein ABI036_16950 [Fibrobacteria bacterium]